MKIETVEVHKRYFPKGRDWRQYNRAPRIYVSVKDETVLQNLDNRLARPSKLYAEAIQPAIKALGLDPATHRAGWSQYAGCSCPCSPGFIVRAKPGSFMHSLHKDVYVTVSGNDAAIDPAKPTRGIFPLAASGAPTNTAELIASLTR